jgi:hypothetical protein
LLGRMCTRQLVEVLCHIEIDHPGPTAVKQPSQDCLQLVALFPSNSTGRRP